MLITGASRGIGAAVAREVAQRRGNLILVGRTQAALDALAAELASKAVRAHAYAANLADVATLTSTMARIASDVGTPDVIVNLAGTGRWCAVDESAAGEAEGMIAVPYLAAHNTIRAFLTAMLRRGSGHIVNVTSAVAYCAVPGATAYTAGCWAVRGFTEALRMDLAGSGIGVTLYASGMVNTPGFGHYPGVLERMPRVITRLVRTLEPAEAAHMIVRAVERNEPHVVIPGMMKWLLRLNAIAPSVVRKLVMMTGWKRSTV